LKRSFRPRVSVEEKEVSVLKITEKLRKHMDLDSARELVKRELVSKHYRVRDEQKGNKSFLYARKRVLGWFGADIVHLGILIIIAGGIISGIGGFRWNLTFSEGRILEIPRAEFKLKLDKFETEYYPNGGVKDWKSTLTVPSFLKKMELKIRERVLLEGEDIEVSMLEFIPDFVIGDQGQITTRSLEPNNPAAFIEGWQGEEKIFSGWIFAKFPDFDRIHSEKETDLTFELKDFKASQVSVIQLSKDPGVNFIWAGCIFLMLGLLFAFYWPPREIRMIMEGIGNKTEIIAGGIASKSKDAFQSEFAKITESIRRSK